MLAIGYSAEAIQAFDSKLEGNLQAKALRLRRERQASNRWGSWPIWGSPWPLIQLARLGFRGFSCSLGLPLGDTAPLLQLSLPMCVCERIFRGYGKQRTLLLGSWLGGCLDCTDNLG